MHVYDTYSCNLCIMPNENNCTSKQQYLDTATIHLGLFSEKLWTRSTQIFHISNKYVLRRNLVLISLIFFCFLFDFCCFYLPKKAIKSSRERERASQKFRILLEIEYWFLRFMDSQYIYKTCFLTLKTHKQFSLKQVLYSTLS